MIALWLTLAAGAGELPFADTLESELERNATDLTLPDAPPVYHLRYTALLLDQVDVAASLGSVVRRRTDPYNGLFVEVRVGTPEFDNTGFGGWQNGFRSGSLPLRPSDRSMRALAWRITDRAYKEAVEQYARKEAQFTPPEDYPGDYTLIGPVVDDLGAAHAASPEALEVLARALSAAMAGGSDAAIVERGEAFVGHEGGSLLIVDTEGARLRIPVEETTLRAALHVRASDGMLLTDQRVWTVRLPEDLPDQAAMVAEVAAMTADLVATASAPVLEEEYVGPVVFEDGAALDLFRYVLVPQLQGTPDEVPFDSFFGDLGGGNGESVRMSRRVLPLGWAVVDDPAADPRHPGSFRYDVEGTPAKRVELVSDGIVHDLLMSRIPRRDLRESNGHARGIGTRAEGRPSHLTVTPGRHVSTKQLYKKAQRVASSYGRDHVLVVRRLQEPAIRSMERGSGYYFGSDGTELPPPVAVYRVYADGREERVRGAQFSGVERYVLRDILAAGPATSGSYLAGSSGDAWAYGTTEGLPTWIGAPSVLVGEMELVPAPGDPRSVPLVPPPEVAVAE